MNKALRWVMGLLVLAVVFKGMAMKDWSEERQVYQKIAAKGIQLGFQFVLKSRYPAASQPDATITWGRDPSYRIYETYRYAYQTYGYLFLSEGETKMEPTPVPEPVVSQMNAVQQEKPTYAMAQLMDYDFLMKHFYSVHPSTTAGRELMNAETFLSKDMRLEQDSSVPQILIYHTHSQETYADYGPENTDANIVGAGNYLTEYLRQKGWNVIHDTSTYDIKSGKLDRNNAYTYALDGITRILQENPSIQVILDLHRDGVKEGVRLVSDVNGKPTASIMFFQGTSRTPSGPIEYLPNPYLVDNLAFTFQMQLGAEGSFPGLTRKIYMKGLRYNLHLRPRSALIEVGAQTNTGEEARNAMEPLGELLDMVLQGK